MRLLRFLNLRVGPRVIASFTAVLAIMIVIIIAALWQLRSVHEMTSYLVADKMVKQQIASDLLNAINLSSAHALSIAKSDSLELADYFEAERLKGEQLIDQLRERLVKAKSDGVETSLIENLDAKRHEYAAVLQKISAFKERGQTQEVEQALEGEFAPALMQYTDSMRAMLDYHAKQAQVVAQDAERTYEQGFILLLCLGALSVALGMLLAWRLTSSIVLPLRDAIRFSTAVAQGNLTQQLVSHRKDEMGQLTQTLNHMNESLAGIVAQVRSGTTVIKEASVQIASGNQDLSSRTERQASALEQTASSMEELTSTVSRNADNAKQASLLAISASAVAARGGEAVSEVVHTMEEINTSAKRMEEIIRVIDGIAFQTNILALNAAVEASRAGEQGRGFAVVAAEVRSLARRSADAAGEIKALINDSVQKVKTGSQLVNRAGATMKEILGSVHSVTGIMNEIAVASQEQSMRIEQVNQAISQMEQGTQQNAALVEEAAAVSQAMQDQAVHLAQMVHLFQIRLNGTKEVAGDEFLPPMSKGSEADACLPSEIMMRLRLAA
jgi:methyl-accepting chemotaxis protein